MILKPSLGLGDLIPQVHWRGDTDRPGFLQIYLHSILSQSLLILIPYRDRSIRGTLLYLTLSLDWSLEWIGEWIRVSPRGQGLCLYSPLGLTTALGSNRLKWTIIINLQSRWRQDPRDSTWLVELGSRPTPPPGRPTLASARWAPGFRWCLLESSRLYFFTRSVFLSM